MLDILDTLLLEKVKSQILEVIPFKRRLITV